MKRIFFSLLTALLLPTAGYQLMATTRTVNNNTTYVYNPGQYNTITAALAASSSGDTILVAGSSNPVGYDAGGLSINKQIVLIGPGYNPKSFDRSAATISGAVTFTSTAANGSVIMGFIFNGVVANQSGVTMNNLTIRRNRFNAAVNMNNQPCTNILFAENLFYQCVSFQTTCTTCSGLVLRNNVFFGNYEGYGGSVPAGSSFPMYTYSMHLVLPYSSSAVQVDTIDHNLFLNGRNGCVAGYCMTAYNGQYGALNCRKAWISNNIFYGMNALDSNLATVGNYINNTFVNNLTYRPGYFLTPITWGINSGTGNIANSNPAISVYNGTSGTNIYLDCDNDNLRPGAGGAAFHAASDGTDIGPTGGRFPIYLSTNEKLTGEPPVPAVYQIMIPGGGSMVAPGSTISVDVRARKIN